MAAETYPQSVDLHIRIQALPQKLRDMVFEWTLLAMLPKKCSPPCSSYNVKISFDTNAVHKPHSVLYYWQDQDHCFAVNKDEALKTIKAKGVVQIDSNYKPSVAMQINRQTRDRFSVMLYKNEIFGGEYHWIRLWCLHLSARRPRKILFTSSPCWGWNCRKAAEKTA